MQSIIAIQPFLFRSWEMTIWTSSVQFVQNLLNFLCPGMVKTWGPQHFPVLIPYLPRTKPVFSNFE